MTTIDLSLQGLRQAYSEGTLTPRVLMSRLQARSARYADHNIWIHILSESELAPYLARLENGRIEDFPLFGVPFAIKDNIDLAHIPTTAGCEAFAYTPASSAFVVAKLIEAGAIPVGKTNLDQFATGLVGTRSPWGACGNAFNPDYISGGSSSGSAVAVALGLASFSLGTDTAGSGRVPAAFNNLIGLKPSLGRISLQGVVPACQSLDCVSIFARSAGEAEAILALAEATDASDPWQRSQPAGIRAWRQAFRFGVPKPAQQDFDGDSSAEERFGETIEHLKNLGGTPVEVDMSPFLEAAKLLYEGPWVAERYLATQPLISEQPDALLPVTRQIISRGVTGRATDAFAARYSLQQLKHRADQHWQDLDVIVTPTAPTIYRQDQIAEDPIGLNSRLGTYTNFMNLLDYSAVSVPAGFLDSGLPWGVTLFAPAFEDTSLLSLAARLHPMGCDHVGHLDEAVPQGETTAHPGTIDVLVCGAHLAGLPLNHQLTDRGATLVAVTETAPAYRMYALAGGPPERPGMIRDTTDGRALPVEVWRVPADRFGSFVAGIPAPLGIGKVELASGDWVCGFICEPCGLEGANDITEMGGWRNYMASNS